MNTPKVMAEPSHAIKPRATQTRAIARFASLTALIISAGWICVNTTYTATTSKAMAKKERKLNRDSVTFSIESATFCGASAEIRVRRSASIFLSQPGSARVAAGTAAFCTKGARLISCSSPQVLRAQATARSTPFNVASNTRSCTLSRAKFGDALP